MLDPLAPALAALSATADQAWRERLLGLQRQARGRWVGADGLAAAANPDADAAAGQMEPVIDASGRLLGRLRVDGTQLRWQGADGRVWRATLPAKAAPAERAASE